MIQTIKIENEGWSAIRASSTCRDVNSRLSLPAANTCCYRAAMGRRRRPASASALTALTGREESC